MTIRCGNCKCEWSGPSDMPINCPECGTHWVKVVKKKPKVNKDASKTIPRLLDQITERDAVIRELVGALKYSAGSLSALAEYEAIECRGDEDCDHCVALNSLHTTNAALTALAPALKTWGLE